MRIAIAVILGLFAACGQSPESESDSTGKTDTTMNSTAPTGDNTLSQAESSEGWQLLFDGQSISSWHGYLKNDSLGAWKVQDGALFLDVDTSKKHNGVDLVTNEDYENFHLKVDWKISKNGNSGIMFSVKEDPKYASDYFTGPEMQVLDNAGHPDAKIIKHKAGDLYDLITSSPETVKPAGEWNTAEIIKNKDSLEFRLNGPTVVKTILWDDNWKKMVAGSKFKEWKDFGTFKSGKIALQDHGDQVWFKNIKIRKL